MMKIYTKLVVDIKTGQVLEEESYEYDGPVAECKGGGGGTQVVQQKSEPPEFQIPYIRDVLERAKQLSYRPIPVYQGQRVASRSPYELLAEQKLTNQVAPGQEAVANYGLQGLASQVAATNPANNPFFYSAVRGAIAPIFDQLVERTLPNIRSNALAAGGYGGSREALVTGLATRGAAERALQTAAQMGNRAYEVGVNAGARAATLAPGVQAALAAPAQTLMGVGNAARAYQQALLDAQMQRFTEQAKAPYDALSYYAGLVGNPLGTSTTQISPGPRTSPLLGALGGGLTGAALGASIPGLGAGAGSGIAGLLGPAGLVGGALGALLGAFS